MPDSENKIEQIVHEVLARMGASAGAGAADESQQKQSKFAPSKNQSGELVLGDNVISAATLADRLTGVQRVVVPARAVITPSARDLLRDENITLVRALKSASAATVQVIVGTADVRFDVGELAKAMRQHGIEIQQTAESGLVEVIQSIAKKVNDQWRGIVLTNSVSAALCLANRLGGVRAVTAANRGEVNEAIHAVGANVLVVDCQRRGKFEVQRIVEAFATAPMTECPPQWKQWLE